MSANSPARSGTSVKISSKLRSPRGSPQPNRSLPNLLVSATLYVKEGCPWCEDAETELRKLGVKYERREVRSNPAYFNEMKEISGQSKA
ncbi:MAG: glutaredoxin family protein, partial [Verrucomicrobia bacterium]|nr:glutaredoxin family protein [Verrucomicrobiota bacterium]